MINLLLGPPGAGKSYEAVVYHVLPALAQGRKVITNLPLQLDELAAIEPGYRSLVELRTETLAEEVRPDEKAAEMSWRRFGVAARPRPFCKRAFANRADFGDGWRHPVSGAGPLYVVDECHLALPRKGTVVEVEEWFSLHRHEGADVLLITQSYSKVSLPIIELAQIVYRLRKATAFGSSKSYVRKVFDGLKGDCVNQTVRRYDPAYFSLFTSRTRGGGAELEARDIVPIWRRWPFVGAAIVLPIGLGGLAWKAAHLGDKAVPLDEPVVLSPRDPPVKVGANAPANPAPLAAAVVLPGGQGGVEPVPPGGGPMDVLAGRSLHYAGSITFGGKSLHLVSVAQSGQYAYTIRSDELERAGYTVVMVGECTGQLEGHGKRRPLLCDGPSVGMGGVSAVRSVGAPAGGVPAGGEVPAGAPAVSGPSSVSSSAIRPVVSR